MDKKINGPNALPRIWPFHMVYILSYSSDVFWKVTKGKMM